MFKSKNDVPEFIKLGTVILSSKRTLLTVEDLRSAKTSMANAELNEKFDSLIRQTLRDHQHISTLQSIESGVSGILSTRGKFLMLCHLMLQVRRWNKFSTIEIIQSLYKHQVSFDMYLSDPAVQSVFCYRTGSNGSVEATEKGPIASAQLIMIKYNMLLAGMKKYKYLDQQRVKMIHALALEADKCEFGNFACQVFNLSERCGRDEVSSVRDQHSAGGMKHRSRPGTGKVGSCKSAILNTASVVEKMSDVLSDDFQSLPQSQLLQRIHEIEDDAAALKRQEAAFWRWAVKGVPDLSCCREGISSDSWVDAIISKASEAYVESIDFEAALGIPEYRMPQSKATVNRKADDVGRIAETRIDGVSALSDEAALMVPMLAMLEETVQHIFGHGHISAQNVAELAHGAEAKMRESLYSMKCSQAADGDARIHSESTQHQVRMDMTRNEEKEATRADASLPSSCSQQISAAPAGFTFQGLCADHELRMLLQDVAYRSLQTQWEVAIPSEPYAQNLQLLRKRHKVLLQKAATACEISCPFDILLS